MHAPRRAHSVRTFFAAALAAASTLALLAGCESNKPGQSVIAPDQPGAAINNIGSGTGNNSAPSLARIMEAVGPENLRIYPLTRLERTDKGELRLICYLELTDRFGHSGKWLGKARVELYHPTDTGDGGTSMSSERQERVWNVDLTDPEKNALAYDWITRTYVLTLGGLPEWVDQMQQGKSREPWLSIRAYFLTWDANGHEVVLKNDFRVVRESNKP